MWDIYRTCRAGVLTVSEAQEAMGVKVKVMEVRPAKCCNPADIAGPLIDATEILFILGEAQP